MLGARRTCTITTMLPPGTASQHRRNEVGRAMQHATHATQLGVISAGRCTKIGLCGPNVLLVRGFFWRAHSPIRGTPD